MVLHDILNCSQTKAGYDHKTTGSSGPGIPPLVDETLFLDGFAPSTIHPLIMSICSESTGPPLGGINKSLSSGKSS